jgi:hypothetical protein
MLHSSGQTPLELCDFASITLTQSQDYPIIYNIQPTPDIDYAANMTETYETMYDAGRIEFELMTHFGGVTQLRESCPEFKDDLYYIIET